REAGPLRPDLVRLQDAGAYPRPLRSVPRSTGTEDPPPSNGGTDGNGPVAGGFPRGSPRRSRRALSGTEIVPAACPRPETDVRLRGDAQLRANGRLPGREKVRRIRGPRNARRESRGRRDPRPASCLHDTRSPHRRGAAGQRDHGRPRSGECRARRFRGPDPGFRSGDSSGFPLVERPTAIIAPWVEITT